MDQSADPKIADKLARMNLSGQISQTKAGGRTLLGKPPRPKPSLAKPGEKFEVKGREEKNAVAGEMLLDKQAKARPGAAKPSTPIEGKPPSAGAVKGAEILAHAECAIQEAQQRRAEAVEALSNGSGFERELNKAIIAEQDAALAFHKAALTYGQAMVDAHSGVALSAEETRGLTRLLAEMGLRRKKYEQARLHAQALRTAG